MIMGFKIQKLFSFIFLLACTYTIHSQESEGNNTFHIGLCGVSTFTTSEINDDNINGIDTISYNPLDIGINCGNEFILGEKLILDLEFFYLNNKVEISRSGSQRFELHQNIGCLVKPGLVFSDHRFFLDIGITAVYVFDKDEEFGNQFDRFDQAIFFGSAYDYRFNKNMSIQICYLHAKFNSISHYTPNELKQFSVLSIGINYHFK